MKTQSEIVFLRGRRVNLRPLDENEAGLYAKWVNDPDVRRFLKTNMPIMRSAERKWVESQFEAKDRVTLVITTKSGKPLGIMGIGGIIWPSGIGTTGSFIGEKKYWGKGYGTEAKMLLLNYCFNTLNLRKIRSRVYSFNARSIAYNKRCGYVEEGRLRRHVLVEGQYHDIVELAVFKEDWLPLWKKYLQGKF